MYENQDKDIKTKSYNKSFTGLLSLFQIENWKSGSPRSWWRVGSKSNVIWGIPIVWAHIIFVSCQSVFPFFKYDFFTIWPWKSKIKVMGVVKDWGLIIAKASSQFRFISFHNIKQATHPSEWANSKFDLKMPSVRSKVDQPVLRYIQCSVLFAKSRPTFKKKHGTNSFYHSRCKFKEIKQMEASKYTKCTN